MSETAEEPGELGQWAVTDLLHFLLERSSALDKSARLAILTSRTDSANERRVRLLETASLSIFKEFDLRAKGGSISYEEMARILRLILGEIEHYRYSLLNVSGFLTRDQPIHIHRSPTNLAEIVDEVAELFFFAAQEKGIEFELNVQSDAMVRIDRELFRRALTNVVDNAVKYSYERSPRGGRRFITIEGRRHSVDNMWSVKIKSLGVGITREELHSGRIFRYGTRGRFAMDRDRTGTGIGLAETRRIIEAHSGRVSIVSESTAGDVFLTIVTLVFPG